MKKLLFGLFCVVVAISIVASGCSRGKRAVTLAGSTAFQPFAEKLAEHYMAAHPEARINVQGGGSAVGIQAALSKSADIGMADLLTLPEEAKSLTATVVAKDGIAIIVNPMNAVSDLTDVQAKNIFSGKISNWKDVGGMDAPIRVVSREDGSGTRRSFDQLVLGGERLVQNALFQDSNGTVREAIATDPNSVGYISMSLIDKRIKALSFNGVLPSNKNVKSNKYPLARPIYFLTNGEMSQRVKEFLDFVLSVPAQNELEKEGLISAN